MAQLFPSMQKEIKRTGRKIKKREVGEEDEVTLKNTKSQKYL